ncbi:nuclear transport factor 2 family protein [Psychroflexus sp. CAK8W]|uniref:Nuclear transport factor 2 family protein n=1 Tax=Psychroflexus longus TaxID=2873596 RepID=A0ABS7XHR5_9FLAO|nr:nuclear transport factor 2 family protein [Psychroflexus longus]MBZ9778493.1 nuclear transport factor 2 family protein [Psychroflexus longus]
MKHLQTLLVLLFFSSISNAQTEQINTTIDSWHKAAEKADFETYFDLMSENAVFVGSDASEVWDIKEFKVFSEPYFDAGKAWTFIPVNRNIYTGKNENIAWFDEVLNSEHMGVCRGSGVLVKTENEKWKIQHYVLSLAVPNSLVDQLVEQKANLDTEYLKSQP